MPLPAATAQHVLARHHGLDWLRIAAFMLLILHHIGLAFLSGGWLVKLDEIDWLAAPMLIVAPWRLALLFVIAGFASRAMLSRVTLASFARERTLRLVIPLIAAMALIIPPQSWIRLRFNHGYQESFSHFLIHDAFAFRAYDGVPLPGWEHLWFVFYLWAYTMMLVAGLVLAPPRLRAPIAAGVELMLERRRLLWVPLLYFVPARVAVAFTLGETHGLFDDWVSDVVFLPCFLLGFALAGSGRLWEGVARCWRPALAVAAVSYAVLVWIEMSYPGDAVPPHLAAALNRVAMAAMMWSGVIVLLQVANSVLNRDHPWRQRLSEAVFPFYIIHQTIVVVLAFALLGRELSTFAGFIVLLCGTVSGCWLFYRLGDLVPAVRPLIGLKGRQRRPGRAAVTASSAATA